MGQQLLLIILVVIIVGLGTIVAIDTMSESRVDSRKSAIRQDILMIVNDAQTYYAKPEAIGGGGNSFDNISNSHIRSIKPSNENGNYQVSGSASSLTVVGIGTKNKIKLIATATVNQDGMQISWADSTQ
ncbi:hypothetical protein [Fodinibius halophilus]|uniref:Type II secretion system protein n=1 Tax=Fodinibius halophilus TaxID=1736908 RepID=A0A6M1TH96_9BACT|nr:hypothetical protein [Fodinibius halophilus]NGP89492.1 hypothetical protein [Fodinibius halophilus]